MKKEEYFDVVDANDRVADVRTRRECLKNGLLHSAVTLFILNSKKFSCRKEVVLLLGILVTDCFMYGTDFGWGNLPSSSRSRAK